VRRWLAQAEVDDGRQEGLTSAEREELTRLPRDNRVLREEREILKEAATFLRTRDDPVSRFRFIAAEKVAYSVVRLCHAR
jgi:transposase-like protein